MVLKTDSVPRTADRPAEHLIAVVFGGPSFLEVALARFKLVRMGPVARRFILTGSMAKRSVTK
ncbi:hypothetical protein BH20VER2_BH20VER2_19640 [soil metagenome]